MKTIPLDDARARLDDLLEAAARGEDVAISRGDGASFRLVPVPVPKGRRVAGLHAGDIVVLPGFDDPMTEFFEWSETDPLREDDPPKTEL